ncbi:MAG: EAL domain-containing protein [bacterium]
MDKQNSVRNKLEILKSFYKALADASEVIYYAVNEKELFEDVSKAVVKCGLFSAVWIGSPGKNLLFKYFAAHGPGSDALKHIKISIKDTPENQTLAARTWRDKKVLYNNYHLKDPLMKPFADFLKKYEWFSAAALPIFKKGEIYAVLAAVSDKTGLFNSDTISLLERIVKLMESALNKIHLQSIENKFEKFKKYSRRKVGHASRYDSLTNLPNYETFESEIEKQIAKARRLGGTLAVMILDLDDLKTINDFYGKTAGDDVLKMTANRLLKFAKSKYKKDSFTVARLGGDEFGVSVFSEEKDEDVSAIANDLLKEISRPYILDDAKLDLKASMGVTKINDLYAKKADPDTLIRMAGQAMYKSKAMGKNTINFFSHDEELGMIEYYQRLHNIENALKLKEFVMYYQPKVNLKTGRIYGFESLIRWFDDKGNIISPAEFIPVAETSDIIVDIGDYVIDETLSQMDKWAKAGKEWQVSINVSAKQLQKYDFFKKLQGALKKYPRVKPALIQLEITETAILDSIAPVKEIIKNCKDIGVTFSMDDFGSGYSSLVYFKELNVSVVKIDIAFIKNMLNNTDDMLIIESVISLSNIFKREVIAEGAETKEHCIILNMLGCPNIQGYYTGRPIPADRVIDCVEKFKLPDEFAQWKDVFLNITDFPVALAYAEHNEWIDGVLKLNKGANISINAGKIKNWKDCQFGKWYYGEGVKYKEIKEYREIENIHKRMHELAYKNLRLSLAGKYEDAEPLVHKINKTRKDLQELLLKLAKSIAR